MTRRAGVIGHQLGHSISPRLFSAAFAAAGIDATYEAWDTPPDALEGRVNALRGDDYFGANVTIPHKEAIVPLLDGLNDLAAKVKAVNTVVHDGGTLVGHNTDVAGFSRALRDDAVFDPRGKLALILGSGGAARAVAMALVEAGAATIFIVGRQPRKVERVALDLKPLTPAGTTITWAYWGDGAFMRTARSADLIVNCTPIGVAGSDTAGQPPIDVAPVQAGAVIFDVIYNPIDTPLVAAARARGLKATTGLGMLVYQAAESFRLWTGGEADVAAMFDAARVALNA